MRELFHTESSYSKGYVISTLSQHVLSMGILPCLTDFLINYKRQI